MLKAIGIRSVDELFSPIPAEFRLKRDLAVPAPNGGVGNRGLV